MPRFRKIKAEVDASQWFKNGDHSDVEPRPALVIFDKSGKYFYIAHNDRTVPSPRMWLLVDTNMKLDLWYAGALPFTFYEVKSGKCVSVADRPDLLEVYMVASNWTEAPKDRGFVETKDGGRIVSPGDWIVTNEDGEILHYKPEHFLRTYEPIE